MVAFLVACYHVLLDEFWNAVTRKEHADVRPCGFTEFM